MKETGDILKILFAPLNLFLSHVTRSLAVAEALRDKGHRVEFMSGEMNKSLISGAGFKIHSVDEPPFHKIVISGAPVDYIKKLYGDKFDACIREEVGFRKMLEQDMEIMIRFQPDVIVCDHRPTTRLASLLADIPYVQIKNLAGYVSINDAGALKADGADGDPEIDYTVEKEMQKEMVNLIKTDPRFMVPRRVQKKIPSIVPGIPFFEYNPGTEKAPDPFHWFTGALRWNGWDKMAGPDKEKYKNTRNILITLGSSFPFQKIIDHIIDAYKDDQYRILINTGNQFDVSRYTKAPDNNVELWPCINLAGFLDICHAVVYHGGHGTAMEVLQAGVPAVIIPFNGDQMEISKRMVFFKCAVRIKKYPDAISREEIKTAIDRVIEDRTYRNNAQKIGGELAKWPDGAGKAAGLIEDFAREEAFRKKIASELKRIMVIQQQT